MIRSYPLACLAALVVLSFSLGAAAQSAPSTGAPAGGAAIQLNRSGAFERARIYYESGNYNACIDAFSRLVDSEPSKNSIDLRQRSAARTYLAACMIASGKGEQAREQFRHAILEDRQMEPPDPVVFPQAVIEVFLQVHGSLMDALRRQQEEELQRGREEALERASLEERERRRVAELERLASTEMLVHRNQRWMAFVPFGVGQFNNESKSLGWLFLTTEAALAASAITATSIELGLESQAQGGQAGLEGKDLTSKLTAARTVGTVSWSAWLVVAVLGIVEANLSYRPEIPLAARRRPLPEPLRPHTPEPTPSVSPRLEPAAGGAWLGVSGAF